MTTISTQNKIFLDPKVAFLIQECLNLWEVYVVRNTCSTWRKTSLKFNPPEEIYNQIVKTLKLTLGSIQNFTPTSKNYRLYFTFIFNYKILKF